MAKKSSDDASVKSVKNIDDCTCDCKCCNRICARMRKVHPIFATIVFIIVIAGAFGIVAAQLQNQHQDIKNLQNQFTTLQSDNTKQDIRTNGVSYDGKDGKTALELLKKLHKVETKDYGAMGEMVLSIDGVKPDSTQFWAFYVNGAMASEGASTYQTKNGDKIEWKLAAISNY